MTKAAKSPDGPQIVEPMIGVREYAEGLPVELRRDDDTGRLVIRAINEGGHNVTHVDLLDLLAWIAERHPDLMPPPPR